MDHRHHHHHSHPDHHALRRAAPLEHHPLRRYADDGVQALSSRLSLLGRATSCDDNSDDPQCEKPASGSSNTAPIVLAAVIPIIIAIGVLIFIHRRHVKKQRMEDLNDKHKSLDFGIDVRPGKGGKKKEGAKLPEMTLSDAAQEVRRAQGLSMNMDGSPYLLPAGLQGSRESFHSMSRSMRDHDDPYRPVTFVKKGDAGSINGSMTGSYRSYPRVRPDNASTFTDSSAGTDAMNANLLRNAQRMSRSYPARGDSVPPAVPEKSPSPPRKDSTPASNTPVHTTRGLGLGSTMASRSPQPEHQSTAYPSHDTQSSPPRVPLQNTEAAREIPSLRMPADASPSGPLPPRLQSMEATVHNPNTSSYLSEYSDYGDGFKVTPPSPPPAALLPPINTAVANTPLAAPVPARNEQTEQALNGLGVQGANLGSNRLSLVVRPLPPDDPTDNPEQRANRIRSFYKEYFDDSRPDPVGQYDVDRYEDAGYYDEYVGEYYDDGAIFDPETGQFVVAGAPYAEPVTRRAMTPPPRAPPRFRGPARGHFHSGSTGYSTPPRGRSAMSARSAPKKNLPPPAPLKSLPTPHMLKEDSMTFNALDFAPPTTFRDRQLGRRADSPLGVQRPYSPSVAPHVPLASPYLELNQMPSPHHLRKSGTFTALDFAPQPRFLKSDNGSDAGSIRSNRSGMSNVQVASLRAGAYRVSRIPKEVVGTKNEFDSVLKPTWDMRGKV